MAHVQSCRFGNSSNCIAFAASAATYAVVQAPSFSRLTEAPFFVSIVLTI